MRRATVDIQLGAPTFALLRVPAKDQYLTLCLLPFPQSHFPNVS